MNLKSRLALCWRILRAESGSLLAHAERELPYIGDDPMGRSMANCLRELVLVFGTQGHSGFSASYARQTLDKLLDFKPISPLTGADEEWFDHGYCKQNKRCSSVFVQAGRFNGQPYDIDAVVFREPSGACFSGQGSHQPITFPYTPKRVWVDVDAEGKPLDGWDRKGICPAWAAE
jgi:hypothetical protein